MAVSIDFLEDELDGESQQASLKELEAMDADETNDSPDIEPLTFKGEDQLLLNIMDKMLREREKEISQLLQVISEKTNTINELLLEKQQLQAEVKSGKNELQAVHERNDELKKEVAELRTLVLQLGKKESPFLSQEPTPADIAPTFWQQSLETIREEYFKGASENMRNTARSATHLPANARATSVSKMCRQKEKPLDWEMFNEIVQNDDRMSELNNDRAKAFLNALHLKHIIDDKFHMRRNITNNVACFIAKELCQRTPTIVKWEIFERLFKRNALRTYDGKTMKVIDRQLCRDLGVLFDNIERELNEKPN